ncbi:hypothetical protein TNCV_151951 [Trichonephila clavipes]|uniref:Uncharacterized protein n=1 Tax=Trichonephila clavipes TaxID=2585209 RepID=A0A8X6V505_TRICX|nr:hypothetical protein TNCV_151951 [Trichonephila clavipes]
MSPENPAAKIASNHSNDNNMNVSDLTYEDEGEQNEVNTDENIVKGILGGLEVRNGDSFKAPEALVIRQQRAETKLKDGSMKQSTTTQLSSVGMEVLFNRTTSKSMFRQWVFHVLVRRLPGPKMSSSSEANGQPYLKGQY